MKKVFVISSLLMGLALASCQKEVIAPNIDNLENRDIRSIQCPVKSGIDINSRGTVLNPDGSNPFDGSSPITDPNNDPDINKKRIK